ncbi:transcriptional repressor LexA [Clostridium tertium]
MVELKPIQKEIYNFLISYSNIKGYPPSVREICTAVGLKSTATVHGHLKALEKKGLLKRNPTKPRALEIVDINSNKKEMLNIPIIKDVFAYKPLLTIDNIEDIFPLPLDFVKSYKSLFMFKVVDSDMINIGLLPGDLAIFEESNAAMHNDVILTKLDNKAKIAKLFIENDTSVLINENYNFTPLAVNDFVILGKLVGIFRCFN